MGGRDPPSLGCGAASAWVMLNVGLARRVKASQSQSYRKKAKNRRDASVPAGPDIETCAGWCWWIDLDDYDDETCRSAAAFNRRFRAQNGLGAGFGRPGAAVDGKAVDQG